MKLSQFNISTIFVEARKEIKMKRLFTYLLLLGLVLNIQAQKKKKGDEEDGNKNLIENPSFEDNNGKVKKKGQIDYAAYWDRTTKIKSDLFVKNSEYPDINIPENFYGKASPSDGRSYAGFIAYTQQYKTQKSYFTTELKESLDKGVRYCFRMDVSLADLSKYASNNIGVSISKKDPRDVESKEELFDDNRIVGSSNEVIMEMDGWETICVPFTAKGSESFLSVGNFAPSRANFEKKVEAPEGESREQILMAYYYVDNLELIKISKDTECTCERDKTDGPNIVYSSSSAFDENATDEEKIKASTIYFYPNKSELTPAAKASLDQLAEVLIGNAKIEISVEGHMDDKEDKKSSERDYYKDISKERANTVIDYLSEKGIDKGRLTMKAHKNLKPISKVPSPLNLAKNRRVEFKM
ncbi:MAG: OmpA family protein [Bacteroidota bacterium]